MTSAKNNIHSTEPTGLFADMLALKQQFSQIISNGISSFTAPQPKGKGAYTQFVTEHNLNPAERVLILLSLAQDLEPSLLTELQNPEKNILISEKYYDKNGKLESSKEYDPQSGKLLKEKKYKNEKVIWKKNY